MPRFLCCLLLLSGCSFELPGAAALDASDAGEPRDVEGSDRPVPDSGSVDGGSLDGEPLDANEQDADPNPDADSADTGLEDATGFEDATLTDADPLDADPPDADPPDADPPDSGHDAGTAPVCGNGAVERPTEACDDGNATSQDGCSSSCQVEQDWLCFLAPSWCFEDDEVIYVDRSGPSCPNGEGAGTLTDPFCRIELGVAEEPECVVVGAGNLGSLTPYNEEVLLDDIDIVLLSPSGARIDGGNGNAIEIKGGSDATVIGFVLTANDDVVRIHQANTIGRVYDSTISTSPGICVISGSGAEVVLERNIIRSCDEGGIKLDSNGGYRVVNNVIWNNGSFSADFGGVYLKRTTNGSVFANNSVLANRSQGGADKQGIRCSVNSTPVINSIIWGNATPNGVSSTTQNCVTSYCNIGPSVNVSGTDFGGAPGLVLGSYRLQSTSQCINAGDPAGTESANGPAPDEDFDNEPRVNRVDVGADEAG